MWGPSPVTSSVQPEDNPEYIAELARQSQSATADQGRACWAALHSYTGCDPDWLAEWETTIPNFNCGGTCRQKYEAYKDNNPPDFSSPFKLWIWGFNLHNWVNSDFGKPELTYLKAIEQWVSHHPN
jgi:hypothetical protein